MAKQSISIGSSANDGTGTSLRDGGDLINDNFNEIYTKLGDGSTLTSAITATATTLTLSNTSFASFQIKDTSDDHTYNFTVNELAANRNVELPLLGSDDVFVFEAHSQTLTNKTLTTPTLTTPIANAGIQLKNGATSAGFLEFFEDSDNGTNKVTLIGPASTADVTITLPSTAGTVALTSDITSGGNIVIPDAGTIGSASDTDAIAIGSDGDVTLTQDLELQHDGAILSFGANDEVTLTHVHDTGILLNSTNVIQFNDASQNIGAPSNAILDINATDEIELNATLADINANLDVSGTYTGGGLMTTGGNIVIPDAGNIGSASDTDAIAIASTGIVTFSQNPVRTGAVNNMIINGDMVVAQRGITITDAAVDNVSTTTNADDSYTLDRWILLSDGDNIVDVKQSDTSPNDGSAKTIQLEVETADKKFGIVQIIENVNCHDALASGKVSLSFKMKASDASIDDVRAAVVSWSGTADSVTSDIVSNWQAEGTNPTLITNATYENTPANLSPTTSFAEYKIENITVDTSNTANILVFIWSGVTDVEVDDSLFITDVQLESGVAANPFVRKPIQQTMLDCERYYETSMAWGEDSQFQGQQVKFGCGSATYNASTDAAQGNRFNTRKRTTPTVTLYHQDGTSGAVYSIHDAAKITGVAAQHINDMGYLFANKSSGFNSGIGYYYGHIVEAEL